MLLPLGIIDTSATGLQGGLVVGKDELMLLVDQSGKMFTLDNTGAIVVATAQAPLRLGYAFISNNIATTVTATGVPTKINGTWELNPLSQWFIINEDNALELTDPEPASDVEIISVNGSMEIIGGGASGYDIMIYLNGEQLGHGLHLDLTVNAASFSITFPSVLNLGDTIELWVMRTDGNDNVVVVDATMIVR